MRIVRPMHKLELSPSVAGNTCAIGVGSGLIAPPLFQLVALALAWPPARLLGIRFNVAIAAVLTLVSNPLTYLPIYSTYAVVGCRLTGCTSTEFGVDAMLTLLQEDGVLAMLDRSGELFGLLILGGLPFSLIGAGAAYLIGRQVARKLGQRRAKARAKRRAAARGAGVPARADLRRSQRTPKG